MVLTNEREVLKMKIYTLVLKDDLDFEPIVRKTRKAIDNQARKLSLKGAIEVRVFDTETNKLSMLYSA